MISLIVAGALALGAVQQQTDTTLAVRQGGTLSIETFGGRVAVRTWDRAEVRIQAAHGPNTRVNVRQSGGNVTTEVASRAGMPVTNLRMDVLVPRNYSVRLEGVNLSADITGVRGSVEIENVDGALRLRDVAGQVRIETVSGPLQMDDVAGSVAVTAVNQSVSMNRVRGSISAETVNGSVVIRESDADTISISTVNGFIEYDGAVRDGGRYFLGTHNGRITMSVPEHANARIHVAATTGKVEAAFPVALGGSSRDSFTFTVGTGSARVELESFNGTIRLVRPGGR